MIAWPVEATADVLEQVRRWTLDAPECLSAVVRVLALPPIDAIPAPIRGRRIVAVVAAYIGPHHDAERVIAPLRGGGALLDTFGAIGLADLITVAGDPEDPGPSRGDGLLLKDLTPDAVATVAELVADEALGALTVLELRQLGGALGRPAPAGHGAIDRVDAAWAFFAGGFTPDAAAQQATVAAIATARERLAPHAAEQVLLNSCAAGADPARAFAPQVWERLLGIRGGHDPDGLIRAAHDG